MRLVLFLLFFNSALNADFQIWNYDSASMQLTSRVDLYTELEFRWKDDATTFYYNHEHVEFPIHVTSYLDIGPCYRQIWFLIAPSTWRTEYEPNLNVKFLWTYKGLKFTDRSRIAYCMFEGSLPPNVWQYRNKLAVYTQEVWQRYHARLFADDEIFIEPKPRGFYENRASLGVNFVLMNKVKAEVGYRLQTVKVIDTWYNNDVLLLNLIASF